MSQLKHILKTATLSFVSMISSIKTTAANIAIFFLVSRAKLRRYKYAEQFFFSCQPSVVSHTVNNKNIQLLITTQFTPYNQGDGRGNLCFKLFHKS